MVGGLGQDTMVGGSGDDTLIGGGGADQIDGGAGIDTADYSASVAGVQVNLNGQASSAGDADGDVLTSIERVIGSALDDVIRAGTADDTLYGAAGNDTIIAGSGADLIDGGAGTDTADYSGATGAIRVALDGSVSYWVRTPTTLWTAAPAMTQSWATPAMTASLAGRVVIR